MPDIINPFISNFSQWAYRTLPTNSAKKLPSVLRNLIANELPRRDDLSHVMVREIVDLNNMSINFVFPSSWCQSKDGKIQVGVVYPYWRHGFRSKINDEYLYDTITWFFHFASQYIARGRFVEIFGAIALTYGKTYRFLYESSLQELTIGGGSSLSFENLVSSIVTNKRESTKERQLLFWNNKLNGLDPYVHRLIFNYIRAIELLDNSFTEEAITALDKTVDVAEQYVRERLNKSANDQRTVLIQEFKLRRSEERAIKHLYQLRCSFGAHPSVSKWWDFGEIYNDDVVIFFEVVKKIIYKVLLSECNKRVVNKEPKRWSNWFIDNSNILWDSVWFDKIPK